MHGLGDHDRRAVAAAPLAADEVLGDNPESGAAGRLGGTGDRAHQPDVPGAVDQAEARRRQRPAGLGGGVGEGRVGAGP